MEVGIFLPPVKDDSFLGSKRCHFGIILMLSSCNGIGIGCQELKWLLLKMDIYVSKFGTRDMDVGSSWLKVLWSYNGPVLIMW